MKILNINAITEKIKRKALFTEGTMDSGILFYEPGETMVPHKHPDLDEIFYVISGKGIININGKDFLIKEKDVMLSPHEESHGFTNNGDKNLVILQIKNTIMM
ncbi:mannose-6-phosphate isomerase-like protein (cupin superfamily) [Clostridium saccharoperbutylacetonicum]|uniref:Cupin 2 conserved barrel domain-containing protein n=1 Tax=Clostridium saccharoperbutylacetonicum N1-4(HMT) TaxID=931276 RepID=M1MRK4_9CLOT|nr:cupin domain-containing protein [Clostridium saccharoperbutylacetonicum]AGF58763.1 cupin 2 conserved barrel domain-containing protein [Clostridium saccharoperbutylacetonicum N1-4(HMT)]NRT60458.1 mannose-6-phosphate isomerase-like protein (cupin superfamily) [Clostridium saccharoperbutylacetonicum]NSB23771.1 mannose-6-phosphate isomerase-like protein (cupin superfamily) [Clostridium saccharoperbutylacetonicum]NSB43148.1 mannose-6-phosphate isomerase-like protein (cupin superfamily) [Clostridi